METIEIDTVPEITDDFIPDPESDPRPNFDNDDVKTCAVVGCENETARTPTGRKGKYCEEHNTSAKRAGLTSGKARKSNRTGWSKAPEVETALNQFANFLAIGVAALGTTSKNEKLIKDGQILQVGLPNVNHELVELAKKDPSFRKYLEWLSAPGKYGGLIAASLAIAVPIMNNHGMLGNIPALLLGNPSDRKES